MVKQVTPPDILVVEDNDDDFEATERALVKDNRVENRVMRCRDGLEAWNYLRGEKVCSGFDTLAQPGLILLDLNMPGLDGRMLLRRIKTHDALCRIPVVVMTTSAERADIDACYGAGANTCIQKPVSWSEFSEAMKQVYAYWFKTALLPEKSLS